MKKFKLCCVLGQLFRLTYNKQRAEKEKNFDLDHDGSY